jgi:hypothetical protein
MTGLEKNEANRWSYMTLDAMERRLEKITNPAKLKTFIKFANANGRRKLAKEAKTKLEFMDKTLEMIN